MAEEKANVEVEDTAAAVQEVKEEVQTQQDPKEYLENFDWEKYEEGIERVDDSKLKEFEALVE